MEATERSTDVSDTVATHMSTEESLSDRLTEEITSLSTKLVTAVSKQSELEEKLFQFHKENHQLKTQLTSLRGIDAKYTGLTTKFGDLETEHKKVVSERDHLDAENKKLEGEVEDLTASLFDEANKMVSDASRETYNFKVKNRKLYEEIDEKNLIIDNLQNELVELKQLFETLDKQNKTHRKSEVIGEVPNSFTQKTVSEEVSGDNFLNQTVFSPKLKAIRFDIENFQEFKVFVQLLIHPTFQFDLNSLKLNKWFKKIWLEEIENCLVVPSTNLFNRWQKGKYFWNAIIEGKIKIEPVKNIQEKFNEGPKSNHRGPNNAGSCEFCQESRTDGLEHLRLHILKLTNAETNESIDYPLCNYCLIKIRNICEFFAILRLINNNVYKLEFGNRENEFKLMKIYVSLCLIRSKTFWSKIGYYDNENEISQINIDQIDFNDFKMLVPEDLESIRGSIDSNEGVKSIREEEREKEDSKDSEEFKDAGEVVEEAEDVPETGKVMVVKSESEPEPEPLETVEPTVAPSIEKSTEKGIEKGTEKGTEIDTEINKSEKPVQEAVEVVAEPTPSKSKKSKKKKKSKVAGLVNAFEEPAPEPKGESKGESRPEPKPEPTPKVTEPAPETNQAPDSPEEIPETIDLTLDDEGFADSIDLEEPQLSRKNSKSKQFSRRVSNGLDDTLKMLQESMHEDQA